MGKIYRHPKDYPIPQLDLLSVLFDSEHSVALPESVLHCEAERPSISLNKVGLQRLFEEFAYGLRKRFNVGINGRNKDVVVIFSSGQAAYPAAFFGVIAAGGVASLASGSYTAKELARQIRQGGASVVLASPDLLDIAREAKKEVGSHVTIVVLRTEPDWSLQVDGEGEAGELRGQTMDERLKWEKITDPVELEKSLIALLYSSGTTGEPKGVMLSHANFVAQITILSAPSREWRASQTATGVVFPPYRSLAHLPAAHIAGVTGYLIGPAFSGGTVFWMKKYNWPDFMRLNRANKITAVYTVPSIYLRIAKDPAVTDHFKTLYYASAGAAPMPGSLQRAAAKKIGTGDTKVGQAYGLSETTGAVTAMPVGEKDDTGSISPVLPNTEVRIVDENDVDVEPGTPGELIVRGPIVTQGYFRNEKATKGAFRKGWFATGDVAIDRGGKFYIVDRIKELIKYQGLQIAPAEIEAIIDSHPSVLESAVVGIPDDKNDDGHKAEMAASEIPRAYVIPIKGAKISEEEIKEHVKATLAPYKQLRGGVVFVDELPKNGLNKLLRRELRDRAIKEIQRAQGAKL
ncbi:4-coumarate-CoA ligase [Tothia fuscella]|uniref:4-coumarate-CoA ligase n=1 Tax=Tothia fuscella TaxID=1048955 RepID=A0A9P4TZX9_9PEZI|nr:4-coumarate-CoA ligase [Tothia fuscella]